MAADINDGKIFPGSGLDKDSDLLAIEGADSRYRLNVITSEDSNYQVLSNVKGNQEREYVSLPAGTNVVKGYVEDKENKAGIYFIHNSNNDHSIVKFNSDDNSFTTILDSQEAILPAWSWDGFVDAGIIGNEDEQYLVWADGRDLHMINIAYAIAGNYNDPITEEEISFFKRPVYSNSDINIVAAYHDLFVGEPNYNLRGKIFQFAIRLKYYDNTYSVFSNYSNIAYPVDNLPSGRVSNSFEYDYISVRAYLDNQEDLVTSLQLLYRIVDIGEGVPSSWYIYEEQEYSLSGLNQFLFKNDKNSGIISDEEAVRPYDYVPDIVNHLGIINSNRVVVDVGREGYENIDVSATITQTDSVITAGTDGIIYNPGSGSISDGNPVTFTYTINEEDDFYINLILDNSNSYEILTYTLGGSLVYSEMDNWAVSLGLTDLIVNHTANSITFSVTGGSPEIYNADIIIIERSVTYKTLKTGANYKFGIVYGYSGKYGTVQTSDDFTIKAEDISDITSTVKNDYVIDLSIQMTSAAPSGATDFRFVSFGSDVDYFEEYIVNFNPSDLTDNSANYTMFLEGNYTVIKKDDIVNRIRKAYGDETTSIEYGFDFQKGDIIKVMGTFILSGTYVSGRFFAILKDIAEYSIDVVTTDEIKLSSAFIREVKNTASPATYIIIQIIRKKESFNAISQDFSPVYPISDHGNVISVTEYFSDIWKSFQVYINNDNASDYGISGQPLAYAWMEKTKVSLYYSSYPSSQGRVNAVNEFATQRGDRRIRWGGQFIDDAGINYLTKFDGDDTREIDDRNGPITKIQQIGDVLKVYQERKVTSFYLNTTSSIDAQGNSTYVFDQSVMSVGRQSIADYGCTHFTSYIKNVRNAYFFDIVNSVVVRDSANGFQPVSDYKMHSYFKQKARDIIEFTGSGTVEVFGGWDEDSEMYIISFVNILNNVIQENAINETLAFHEPSNRWITFFSFIPEYYGKISGDQLLSFKGGVLYEHNVNTTRNNFYGDQYESEVYLHSNAEAVRNKIYNSIEITSVGQWECPDDDSIVIERPIGMQSRLILGKFKRQEGIYRAEFMRDMLTGATSPTRYNLFNGRQLRGQEMTIKLKNDDTTQALLESVLIQCSISK